MHVDLQNISEKRSLRGSDRTRKHSLINWPAIEVDFRGGTLSLRDMALKHGCSHSTIANHAGLHKWTRDVEHRPTPVHAASGLSSERRAGHIAVGGPAEHQSTRSAWTSRMRSVVE